MEATSASSAHTILEEQRVLVHDNSKCTACLTCMIACSMRHFGYASFEKSFIQIRFNPDIKAFEAIYCHHCDNPYCMNICPVDAISKDEKTGIVKTNFLKCIGCGSCNLACPMSVPHRDPELRVAVKCDLCDGDPECVKACPTQAIQFVPRKKALDMLKTFYG